MNNVSLTGRLVRNPETKYTNGAEVIAICRYTLAVPRKIKTADNIEADFINCICFRKTAEFAEKHFRKGLRIGVRGRIQTGSYKNKEGNIVYTTEVVVEEQEFLDYKDDNSSGTYTSSESFKPDSADANSDGFMSIPDGVEDSGLPFN